MRKKEAEAPEKEQKLETRLGKLQFEIQKHIDNLSSGIGSSFELYSQQIQRLFEDFERDLQKFELLSVDGNDDGNNQEEYGKILKQLKLNYKNAILSQKAAIESKNRQELLRGAELIQKHGENQHQDSKVKRREIGQKFDQVNRLLFEQVERSQLNLASIQSSSKLLGKTKQVYSDELSMALSTAKKSLKTLSIRQKTDL